MTNDQRKRVRELAAWHQREAKNLRMYTPDYPGALTAARKHEEAARLLKEVAGE